MKIIQIDDQLSKFLVSFNKGERIGKVHSIYEQVINILSEDGSRLISLALEQVNQAPFMMKTNDYFSFKQLATALEIGDGLYLLAPNFLSLSNQLIELEYAIEWNVRLKGKVRDFKQIAEHLWSCQVFLDKLKCKSGMLAADRMSDTLYKPFPHSLYDKKLTNVLSELRKGYSNELAIQLIGLGIGLTPSGDDFLTGMWSTWIQNDLKTNLIFKEESKEKWERLITARTTVVSKFMLLYCLEGYVNEALYNTLTCPLDKKEFYMKELVNIGSTSGTDMLVGVKVGYEILVKNFLTL